MADWNLVDWKMTDNIAGVEIAGLDSGRLEFGGLENDRQHRRGGNSRTGQWQTGIWWTGKWPDCNLANASPTNFSLANSTPAMLSAIFRSRKFQTASTVLGGSRIHRRTTLADDKLDSQSRKKPQRLELTWEQAETVTADRQEWHRSVAQCIHGDAGWIKFKVEVSNCLVWTLSVCNFFFYAKYTYLTVHVPVHYMYLYSTCTTLL